MKNTKIVFFGLVAFVLAFASCSNVLETKSFGSESVLKNGTSSLQIKFPKEARYIAASDYDISKITDWTFTYKDESDSQAEEKTLSVGDSSGTNTTSVSYENGTLKASFIPLGTYTIKVIGRYTNASDSSVTVSGSANGVVVSSDASKNEATIVLGLEKSSGKTGNLSLTLNDKNSSLSNIASTEGFSVTLQSISDSAKEPIKLKAEYADQTLTTLTVTGENIPSGWYKIDFKANESIRISVPSDKIMIEIADGITTTASIDEIYVSTVKTYYATNDESTYNGLALVSRANLTTLLEKLAKNVPTEGMIEIKVNGTPELNIESVNSLKEKLSSSKIVSIYGSESSSSAAVGFSSLNTTLSGSVILAATENTSSFSVDSLNSEQDSRYTVTLKGGASLNVSNANLNSSINIRAVDSTGTSDNFSYYVSKPFITVNSSTAPATAQGLEKSISLYEYGNESLSTNYAVVSSKEETSGTTTYSYYVKPSSIAGFTFKTSADATISAAFKADTEPEKTYSSGEAIPYQNSTLSFTLNGISGVTTYAWYLNGKSLGLSNSETETETQPETQTTSFNLYKQDGLNIDTDNTVSCLFNINGESYISEFTFKFSAARTAVWVKQLSETSYSLGQGDTEDDKIADASNSTQYFFGSDGNLWVDGYDTSVKITKYPLRPSSGYKSKEGEAHPLSGVSSPSDFYYDSSSKLIYILSSTSSGGTASVYAYNPETKRLFTRENISITTTGSGGTRTPSHIAVYGNTIYIADSDLNIYKSTITVNQGASETTLTVGTFSSFVSLASDTVLTGYDGNYDKPDKLSIKDLQIGDGLGSNTDTLYALVRESYLSSDPAAYKAYSRGAVVEINTTSGSPTAIGWTTNETSIISDGGYNGTLYAPSSDSSTESFYGPSKIAALVPKKLVFVDDGFTYVEQGKVKNNDSLVEFDIESKTWKRSTSITATIPGGSGFTAE